MFFLDESTFQCNDDQITFWGTKGTLVIKPCQNTRDLGSWLLISLIDSKHDYLALPQEEYDTAKVKDSSIKIKARVLLEYGDSKEVHWTCDKFMEQIKMEVKTAEVKYT